MQRLRQTVIKNAAANVVRGGASAAVALALPHFLVAVLDRDRFSSWSLILQIAAFANYLDFGLQTAVARFLAQAIELDQHERRKRLISTALLLLSCAGLLALLIIGLVVLMLPRIFHGVPADIVQEVRFAALILGTSTAVLLPSSVYTGVLVGLMRNEVPAFAIGGSRILGAIAVIVTSHYTHSLIVLAACVASANLLGGASQWIAAERLLPGATKLKTPPNRQMTYELLNYCVGLMVFSFGMLLYSGLDITIVGHFAFSETGYYAIAATLIAFAAGVQSSVLNALLSPIAALHAKGEFNRIRGVVLKTTRLTTSVNLIFIAILCIFGPYLLRIWVGPSYSKPAYPIILILMLAQLIRQTIGPYCSMLVAAGNQLNAAESAISEALINVTSSYILAQYIGALGVACGTLIGAGCGIIWVLVRIVKKKADVPITSAQIFNAVGPSFLCAVPVMAAWGASFAVPSLSSFAAMLLDGTGLLITIALLWRFTNLIPQGPVQKTSGN